MAARKKKRTIPAYQQGREFKLRLPPDVSERIERKAEAEGRPQNRVIINELAAFPTFEVFKDIADTAQDYRTMLARYSARIVEADLKDDLLQALRDVLQADEANNMGELRARLAKLRVIFVAMEKQRRG